VSWSFDTKSKRYRSDSTGRFLARKVVTDLRDTVVDAAAKEARDLAGKIVRGEITAAEFREGMRLAIRNSHTANYLFGRGGVRSMTPSDWGRMGQSLRIAYERLEPLVQSVEAGTLSEAQAMNRATMATDGATRSHEDGKSAAWGIAGKVPEMPGDRCVGMSRCRCSWSYAETESTIECTWVLGGDDPCEPCQSNAATYNPWVIPKPYPGSETEPQPVRLFAVDPGWLRIVR
jgi:hypothetical protein